MDLIQLFCDIDDFVKALRSNKNLQITTDKSNRGQEARMSLSEIMIILVLYHSSGYKNFKYFYLHIKQQRTSELPSLLS
jgi:hypothetical protein